MIRTWNRSCRSWRKQCIRRMAWNYQRSRHIRCIRRILVAAICLEIAAGTALFWQEKRLELSLVRREEICEVELISKEAIAPGNAVSGESEQDIYGIRLDTKNLEVQFYHRKDFIRQ